MNGKYKTSLVFKISILLLSLMLISGLLFRATYGRYISESKYEVGFLAESLAPIYFDGAKLSSKTLFQPSQWQSGVNHQISGSITLSNIAEESEQPPQDDIVFCLRAYVFNEAQQIETAEEMGEEEQTQSLPIEITLSTDENVVYPSKAETIKENTEFYNKNQKTGQFYCFYDSIDSQNELKICLQGEKSSQLNFTITAYNAEIDSSQIFICVERIK